MAPEIFDFLIGISEKAVVSVLSLKGQFNGSANQLWMRINATIQEENTRMRT